MENYKEDIQSTRVGCLGSSDGKILEQICSLGGIPKSAYKRLAVCKGLIPQVDIPKTDAIVAGDVIEMAIYNHLAQKDPRYESNVKWVSTKYSYPNVKLIAHPDIILKDDARKTLFVYEVKTSKYSFEETRVTYKPQLFIENILAHEIVESYGKDWTVKLFLVHYSTDGLDLSKGIEFEPSRMTLKEVRFSSSSIFDVKLAMGMVNAFLDTFTEYYEGEEIDADLLPANVRNEFEDIACMLTEIKERETKIESFKKRLYDFMVEKEIKSIKNDLFSITRVDPTESKSFDGKKYLSDLSAKHPRKAKKILSEYTKTTKKSGYAKINVKEQK